MAVITSPVNMKERADLGIQSGDTVRVWQKIEEKGKTRLQAFEGLVLARKHGNEAGGTFTVRKVASGVGVEKIFPLYSPVIDKIEIVKRAKVRRAKLYYVRDKVAREMKRALRKMKLMDLATQSEQEQTQAREKAEQEKAEAAAKAEEEAKKKEEEAKAAAETTAQEDTNDDTVAEKEETKEGEGDGDDTAKKE